MVRVLWFAAALVLLGTNSVLGIDKGTIVVVKRDAELKRSGEVVGKVKAGDVLKVMAVRGAWIELGESPRGWIRLSDVSTQDEAIAHFDELLANDPENAALRIRRGQMLASDGKLEAAEAEFRKVLDTTPDAADAHFELALLSRRQDRELEALDHLRKAIDLKEDPRFYRERGEIHQRRKNFSLVVKDFEKVVELEGADARVYNTLAWWYATDETASGRDGKKAVEYALKACELTHFDNHEIVDTLAAAYAEKGDFTNALKYQEMAIRLCSDPILKSEFEARLKKYQLNEPYREPRR